MRVICNRSSPVLFRFSKQLKLGLSDTAAPSIDAGAPTGSDDGSKSRVLASGAVICQQHLCLTESFTDQHCCTQPALSSASQLSPASLPSHTRHPEKNIFSSICLNGLMSQQPADQMPPPPPYYADNEMPSQCMSFSISEQRSSASVASVSSDFVTTNQSELNWSKDDGGVIKDLCTRIDPSCSGNCDAVSEDIEGKLIVSEKNVEEPLIATSGVSESVARNSPSAASSTSLLADTAAKTITPLQGTDLHASHVDNLLPNISTPRNVENRAGMSECLTDRDDLVSDYSSVSSEASCHALDASVDDFSSSSQVTRELLHHHRQSSGDFNMALSLTSVCCTSSYTPTQCFPSPASMHNLPPQRFPLTTVPSCPVPVSLFCAQTCTTSTAVPVALFRARSCSSPVSPSTTDIGADVSHSSLNDGICSNLSEVSVSLSTSEIPGVMVQCNPSQLTVAVDEETEKDKSDGNVSERPMSNAISLRDTVCRNGVKVSSHISASETSVNSISESVITYIPQSAVTSESAFPAVSHSPPADQPQHSVNSEASTENVSNLELLPSINESEIDSCIEERSDADITNSDVSHNIISNLHPLPTTNVDCETEDLDVLNSDAIADNISHIQQLPITNRLQREAQGMNVSAGDEPGDQISDELIVSEILAADAYQCEPLEQIFTSHQQWREMLSPVISSRHLSEALEENSESLSLCDVVTAEDASSSSVMGYAVSELIEMNLPHQIRQREHAPVDLLPAVVDGTDSWMYDDKLLQDVLCSLLKSCHVDSADSDNSLPLNYAAAAAASAVDDDDAQSFCSSSTEVYVDLPEDMKLDEDADTRCDSPQDKDSDGTVSLLSVVLDGEGLDLMDSASDGFQNIYSSLVDPAQLDRELCSDVSVLNGNNAGSGSQPTNLSAFSVEEGLADGSSMELLLNKQRCSAVMALDVGLVKNLPCSTTAISSLCDKLEETKQLPNKDEDEVGLQTDAEGSTSKSVSCCCSELHVSKKSCRSSLRMPEKLADIDPDSPSLACRPPPLSAGCGKYPANMHSALETTRSTDVPSTSGLSQGVSDERPGHVRGRKRKHGSVSHTENKNDVESSHTSAEMKSHDKSPAETWSPSRTGNKVRNKLQSFGCAKTDRTTALSKRPAVVKESCTLRIHSSSQIIGPLCDTPSLVKRRTSLEARRATRSMLSGGQKQQTMFTLEDTRSGSRRTIILNKPMSPPMLSTVRKSKSNWKLEQVKGQQKLNRGRSKSGAEDEEKERKTGEEQRPQPTDDDADDDGQNKDHSEEQDEKISLRKKKMKKKNKKKKKQNGEGAAAGSSDKRDASLSSDYISQDESCKASRTGTDGGALDQDGSSSSSVPRGRPRKRCSLLAQLENSEGFVAERNVPASEEHGGSLLWSDTNSLSREERALQVSACCITACTLAASCCISDEPCQLWEKANFDPHSS